MRRIVRFRKGFTLIELLVVVLILGILVTLALPAYMNTTATAKQNAADANARIVAGAIQASGVRASAYSASALTDPGIVADLGGAIPNNPCSASGGAAGYSYAFTNAKTVSLTANSDACANYSPKTFALKM